MARNSKKAALKNIGIEVGKSSAVYYNGYSGNTDYNSDLRGPKRIRAYNEMLFGDATVRACFLAIKLPILRASWYFELGGESPQDKEAKEFVEQNLMYDMSRTWAEFLSEALTYLPHGNAVFEQVYEFSEDGKIRLKKLAKRPSDTIHAWALKNGNLGVVQKTMSGEYEIPIEELLILVNEKEGENWEGVSIFRSAYRNHYIKDKLYQIDAIAAERQGLGIPVAEVPSNYPEKDMEELEDLLQNFRANEKGYLIKKGNIKIEVMNMGGHTTRDIMPSISHHNREIAKSVLADFLELGVNATGSYALSQDKTEMFLLSLEAVATHIASCVNEYVVKRLVDLNFNVKEYPKLQFGGLRKTDIEKISASLEKLASAGIITVDDTLEDHVRTQFDLPEKEEIDEEEDDVEAHDHHKVGHRTFKNRLIQSIREEALSEIKEMKEAVDRLLDGDEQTPVTPYKL